MTIQQTSTIAIRPSASVTATENGAAVNIQDFQGLAKLVLDSSVVNAGTSTVKIQDSADGSTGWADVTNWAFTAVGTVAVAHQELLVNIDNAKKFIRAVNTMAGGANVQAYSVQLVGTKQAT